MRRKVTVEKLRMFIKTLGESATGPGSVYLVGGSTALLLGIREQTVDIDIKLDPEPAGTFEAISMIKNSLDINVELAAPDDFIPPPPDWRERSIFIETVRRVNFFHYDMTTQALAKLERGHDQDLRDVRAFLSRELVTSEGLLKTYELIRPLLLRYPAVDPEEFEMKVRKFIREIEDGTGE